MRVMLRTLGTLLVFALLAAGVFAQVPDFAEIKKEAEAGSANAQYILGVMYDNGDDVPKDSAEAVNWYRKAAEQGDAMALGTEIYRTTNTQPIPR